MTRRLVSGVAFVGALIVYLLTLEPDASYWDCPEYLVTALRLEVGHPPGNPVWTLTSRVVSMLGGNDPRIAAVMVNASSALFTALAVGMLASCAFIMLTAVGLPTRSRSPLANAFRGVAALGGALCFGWADSPWFSAVEAEVYGMSLFLTALTIRLMLGWAAMPKGARRARHILLIVYLTGLAVGVHQLNLLAIPALGLIWLYRDRRDRAGWMRVAGVILASFAVTGGILLLVMPGVIACAARLELMCVNSLHMPPHSGVWLFWATALAIGLALPALARRRSLTVKMIAWMPLIFLTGYSSYMILLVRSAAEPPMNEGAPVTILALDGYLGRDQYGSTPLFYGRTPYSHVLRRERIRPDGTADYSRNALEEGKPLYLLTDSGYIVVDHARRAIYAPELNMLFPRLTSSDPSDIKAYADWAGMTQSSMKEVEVSFALDSAGNAVGRLLDDGSRVRDKELRPTYMQQLRYMLGYQIGYMYLRYMMWNYSGRQNDRFAVGEVEHGNFITGIPPLDRLMLGATEKMPREIGPDNPGHNVYFMLPLLFGIAGIIAFQRRGIRGRRANSVVLMLFLMTGLAIVVYLNQSPREPRERDYSFLGSMWAYAIWISAGMALLLRAAVGRRRSGRLRGATQWAPAAAVGIVLFLPAWMLGQNYDDHDRSGRQGVSDYAANLLESLEPDAILFTNGDNFTFPLWWAQEVMGIRRDVTVINTAYLGTSWYVERLRIPGDGRKGLEMTAPPGIFKTEKFKYMSFDRNSDSTIAALPAREALMAFYAAPDSLRKLPARLRIGRADAGVTLATSDVASGSSRLNFRQFAALDILTTNADSPMPRPVYWLSSLGRSDYAGLYPYTIPTLHARRLVYTSSPADSLQAALLDSDMTNARLTRTGRRPGRTQIYADDTFGRMITTQRVALLRLGGRLLAENRYDEALEVAKIVENGFPAAEWEYQVYMAPDSACHEGIDLARLWLEGGAGLHPNLPRESNRDYMHGYRLLLRENSRLQQWRDYRRALPPRLRGVMSPKNAYKAQRTQELCDSLLRVYGRGVRLQR